MRSLLCLTAVPLMACLHRVPELPPAWRAEEPTLRAHANSVRDTVQALVDARVNLRRTDAAEQRARSFQLPVRREGIDWFSMQDNLLIELPGDSPRLIYLVAHADKTDMNPLKVVSVMVNGLLDEPFNFSYLSEGALDNASGVAVVLEVGRALRQVRRTHTLRILVTGSEESGLRGARAHVARLSAEEWARIDGVINVDSVGKSGEATCVVKNESDGELTAKALALSRELSVPLLTQDMPALGGGDHAPFASTSFLKDVGRGVLFNVTGGVLPQRSWFTGSHGARVIAFFSCNLLDAGDWVSAFVALPIGALHGPRDNAGALDPVRLAEVWQLVHRLTAELSGARVEPGPTEAAPSGPSAPSPSSARR